MEAIKINTNAPMIEISTKEALTDRQIDIRAKKWAELDATIKALKAEQDAIRAELVEEGTRQTRNYIVTVSTFARRSVDSARLAKNLPNIYAEFSKVSEQTRLSIKRI